MQMKAVILAAGQGVRLKPLTNTRPKIMLQVAGKPIIMHLLQQLKKARIKEAVIVVRYMKEQVIQYFKEHDPGIKLTFVEQDSKNGTAAALLATENHIDDTFVAIAGDIVTESEVIEKVIQEHKKGITLAVKKVPNPHEYGVVELSGSTVSLVEEKVQHPKSDLANLSIYCMEPTVFHDIRSIQSSPRGEYELTDLLVGAKAVKTDNFWLDVGYPWHLFNANDYLLGKMEAQAENIENSTINGKVIMEEGARIFNSYIEGNCYVGKGSTIGPNSFLKGNNSLGENCCIGESTTVKNSILFDRVNAKHLSYIGDSIIGSDVNFGSGTQVANFRFDGEVINVLAERGWTNSGRKKLGVIVGDNTKFGVLSSTMPGKLIGENCWIGSGAIINKNIAPNTHVLVKQELTEYKERKEE